MVLGFTLNSLVASFIKKILADNRLFGSECENIRASADEVRWHRNYTSGWQCPPPPLFLGCEWSVPEMMYSIKSRAGGIILRIRGGLG